MKLRNEVGGKVSENWKIKILQCYIIKVNKRNSSIAAHEEPKKLKLPRTDLPQQVIT